MTDSSVINWIVSALSGLVSGALGVGLSISWFGGETKATLEAHDKRISTLENDIRYEIRAIRESIHGLRNEMMQVIHEERKRRE